MSFLNPWALLCLLAVPALVLLYFLKLKRPEIPVPSTLLWQKVIEDMRVNSPFQRLKRSLLLLLQILALLGAILALTRPLLRVREHANESFIALLDNSASMMTVEGAGRTRLDLAKAEIGKLADRLTRHDEMMLIVFNSRARVACGFSANRRAIQSAASRVAPTECATSVEPALLLAKSICATRSHPRIVLYSDGSFDAPKDLQLPVPVEYQKIGAPRPNLAVTGLDIRRALSDRSRIEMFVAVENFGDQAFSGNMAVQLDDRPLDSKYFSVGPRETLSQIFEAVLPQGGCVSVALDAPDALACDNRAWRMIGPPTRRRLLIVGESTFFLERLFRSAPGTEYVTARPGRFGPQDFEGFSTVIWCRVPQPAVAPCHNIYLGCCPAGAGAGLGAKVSAPEILDWDHGHPVNRFIGFENLLVADTAAMTLPESATVILRSARTPLIGLFRAGEAGLCVVGFDPMNSNWPLLVSFPLFLSNCLQFFEDTQTQKVEANIAVGRAITVRGEASAPSIRLPDGREETLAPNPGGDYAFTEVTAGGVYRVRLAGGETRAVAANLFDRRESSVQVVEQLTIGGKETKPVQIVKRVDREFWKYGAMALAFLLAIEWVVYHRRWFA
jgi:hypothetical protein